MLVPKMQASNLVFEDLKNQPEAKFVCIFHSAYNRGALAVDALDTYVERSLAYCGGEHIATFSRDVSFIMIKKNLVNIITTEENIEKMIADAGAIEKLKEKHADLVVTGMEEAEPTGLPAGHYL